MLGDDEDCNERVVLNSFRRLDTLTHPEKSFVMVEEDEDAIIDFHNNHHFKKGDPSLK
jgi:hypothetical protein